MTSAIDNINEDLGTDESFTLNFKKRIGLGVERKIVKYKTVEGLDVVCIRRGNADEMVSQAIRKGKGRFSVRGEVEIKISDDGKTEFKTIWVSSPEDVSITITRKKRTKTTAI